MRRLLIALCSTVLILVACNGDSETAGGTSSSTSVTPTATVATTVPTSSTSATTAPTDPAQWPSERVYHAVPYDDESAVMVLVGGCEPDCMNTWAFDVVAGEWNQLGTLPEILGNPDVNTSMAYDAESDRIVALPGSFDDATTTWVYDANTDSWVNMAPDPNPQMGVGTRLVYDSESDRVIAYGGSGPDRDSLPTETWAYDHNTNTWELLEPETQPPGINFHAMAYDTESDRVVLFGLADDGESLLWAYDYNSNIWEEMPLGGAPSPAWGYGRAAYDAASDRTVLFGGFRFEPEEGAHNETWLYDYNTNTWESATANTLAGPLALHDMVYVDRSRVIVFGGEQGDEGIPTTGLWVYDPTADIWSEVGR